METRFEVQFKEIVEAFCLGFEDLHLVNDGGYERGYAEGHDVGYAEGENVGYAHGYDKGVEDTTPSGEIELTENNKTYDVVRFASAKVKVPNKLVEIFNKTITEVVPSDLDGVSAIPASAFASCLELEKVVLPEGIVEIGNSAFDGCFKLSNIQLNEGLQSIGEYAFRNAGILSLQLPSSLPVIGRSAFYYCQSLKELHIPSTVKEVQESAFYYGTNIETLTIAEGVETIKSAAFYSLEKLKELKIPNSVTSLGQNAFAYCRRMRKVEFGRGVQEIPQYVCRYCSSLSQIIIPEGVTKIHTYAFGNGGKIGRPQLPSTLTTLGSAFYNTNVVILVLPKSVTTIANNCTNQVGVVDLFDYGSDTPFPTIESSTFYFPPSMQGFSPYIRVPRGRKAELAAMTNWSKHASIMVEVDTPFVEELVYQEQLDGTYYISGMGTFVGADLTLPETYNSVAVTGIRADVFYTAPFLERLVVGGNFKQVASQSFRQCTRLEEVTLLEGVQTLAYGCFQDCSVLSKVTFPNSITEISTYAFRGCDLREVVVPPKATEIYDAFSKNKNLTKVVLNNVVKRLTSQAFFECSSLPNIIIPKQITSISTQVFQGCTSLEYIDMTSYDSNRSFPTLGGTNSFTDCGTKTAKGTFEIRVLKGRGADLAAMTNWSAFIDNIVEVE